MLSIVIDYSYWWLVLIFLIAAIYSFVLYRKEKNIQTTNKLILYLLRILRFITVAILLFLLLNPLLKTINKYTEKPVIAILQDNSSSIIANKDSSFYKTEYLKKINKFKNDISSNFNPIIYTFGSNIKKTDSISFTEKKTNIVNSLQEINKLYTNRNLGAIILASDGIYNSGLNPEYFKQYNNTFIYTILLGDTTQHKDVLIKNVLFNKDVFLGNTFPVEVKLESKKIVGTKINIKILLNNKIIDERTTVAKKTNTVKFKLKANKKGLVRYKIIVTPNNIIEENINNNKQEIVVNIIDKRKKILLLSNSPHPDIYAIRSALANSNFYKLEYKIFNEKINNLKDYDLIIFHQLPSINKKINNIIEQIHKLNISVLFIIGAQTNISSFNKLNENFKIYTKRQNFEETAPEINSKFSLFTLPDEFNNYISELPPLISYFADYKSTANAEILFNQKIRNILTDRALFIFSDNNLYRSALISGEGIWRWKIYDYKQNKSFNNFNLLINKTVQYLTTNLKNNPLNISYNKIYQTNDEIIFNAQFLNKSFELINTPDLTIEIKNTDNKVFNYSFDKYNDKYKLKISGIEKGDYTFSTKLKFAGTIYKNTGSFSVINKNIENLNTVANHKILKLLSNKTNANWYSINQINKLKQTLLQNNNISKVSYYQTQLSELINNIWIFIIIILVISLEWFIRKFLGGY